MRKFLMSVCAYATIAIFSTSYDYKDNQLKLEAENEYFPELDIMIPKLESINDKLESISNADSISITLSN